MSRLDRNDTVLVIIDVQEKLMPVIDGSEEVERNIDRLVRGCHILGVPAILTEQYVRGLGSTVATVRRAFEETRGYRPIEKDCFSAQGCDAFAAQLAALERKQVLVAGVGQFMPRRSAASSVTPRECRAQARACRCPR